MGAESSKRKESEEKALLIASAREVELLLCSLFKLSDVDLPRDVLRLARRR